LGKERDSGKRLQEDAMLAEEMRNTEQPTARLATPPTVTPQNDARIITQALGALEREKLIPGLRVRVSVESGWLTISGDAPHKVERSAAECVVRSVPGVKGVTNRIVVAMADRR
jgi:osmotically-inducible protein OsmY